MINNLLIVVHTSHTLMSLSINEMLILRMVNLSTNFREPPFSVEMSTFSLRHLYSILYTLTWRPMPLAACSRLCSKDSAWVGVFARSAMSSAWSVSTIVFARYCLLLTFFSVKLFSLDLLIFEVHSPGKLWINNGLMYPLSEHQQQHQKSLCLHLVSKLLLSCFYRASSWLQQFLSRDPRLEVFVPYSLCVWRNLQIRVSPWGFLHKLQRFDALLGSVMWIGFSENHFDSS